MGKLNDMMLEQMREVPRMLATDLVRDKLAQLGHGANERLISRVVDELLADSSEEERAADVRRFELGDYCGVDDQELSIEFTPDDIVRLEEAFTDFTEELPDILRGAATEAAKVMLKSYENRWAEWQPHNENELTGFRLRLQARWGKGFDALRMLIELSRDIGIAYQRRVSRRRSRRMAHIGPALMHLHVRAVQISSEIMTLMENGFADGAMARWRTLNEVTCVAMLLDAGGDELAERYLLHEHIEARKALRAYQEAQPLLGYRPFAKREAARIERDYQHLLARFGKSFGTDYDWAADHLSHAQPTFWHIQDAVGRQKMRSHYKMASHNVHAGTKGIAHRLGAMPQAYPGIAGASNVGFVEPGQNLAISLVHISMLLLPKTGSLDDLAHMAALNQLQTRVPRALSRAQRAIQCEEEEKSSRVAKTRSAKGHQPASGRPSGNGSATLSSAP